jgi:PcfJ-like protein
MMTAKRTGLVHHPVHLLWDIHGIYGIGEVAGSDWYKRSPQSLILRPDRLSDSAAPGLYPVLQQITGRLGPFYRSLEGDLRKRIHHELLLRRGLPPPSQERGDQWWSHDPKQQAHNRRLFHALREKSAAIINSLIRQALAEAADPDALKLARRFPFRLRYPIYRAASLSLRALQLADTFPTLALALYCRAKNDDSDRRGEATQLVEAGAPLRRVAEVMNIPMALRRVKPMAADYALAVAEICARDPRLFHAYLPDPTPRAKIWLRTIRFADSVGPEFTEWAAKHCLEISGERAAVFTAIEDLSDWVRAGYRSTVPPHVLRAIIGHTDQLLQRRGDQFITRRFSPDMSLRTVLQLSAEWHETVAANMTGPDQAFPPPWCEAGQSGGYDIIPITTAGELYLEGRAMHHCAGTYSGSVMAGSCCFFSIRKDNKRVATLQLQPAAADKVRIGQLRGPCNAVVPKDIERAVNAWLRAQVPRLPQKPPQEHELCFFDERVAAIQPDPLDDIPF